MSKMLLMTATKEMKTTRGCDPNVALACLSKHDKNIATYTGHIKLGIF